MAKFTALYAAGLTVFGFLCFAITSTTVGVPIWGEFKNTNDGHYEDKGYFGPWKVCLTLSYSREKCGNKDLRFRPSYAVYISGLLVAISAALLGFFCILSVIQIAMISSREKVVMKYSALVSVKFALAILACLLNTIGSILLALKIDSSPYGFTVTRGASFYLLILAVILSIGLSVMSFYDLLYTRRTGGDPTKIVDLSPSSATTINNPGYRDGRTNGVSVTDASGKPYAGSIVSMNTTTTSVSGSTVESMTRSPLRSSLKKPRVNTDPLGIRNPGFSGSDPPMHRNGSMKKVRIQTHSTEV